MWIPGLLETPIPTEPLHEETWKESEEDEVLEAGRSHRGGCNYLGFRL